MMHPLAREIIAHRPQAENQRLRTGDGERAPQPQHALAGANLSQPGVAGGKHRHFHPAQIQTRDFLGGENAVVAGTARRVACVCSRKREPGEPQHRASGGVHGFLAHHTTQGTRSRQFLRTFPIQEEAVGRQVQHAPPRCGGGECGLIKKEESFVSIKDSSNEEEKMRRMCHLLERSNILFIFHAKKYEIFPLLDTFSQALQKCQRRAQLIETFYQRDRQPVYLIYEVLPL